MMQKNNAVKQIKQVVLLTVMMLSLVAVIGTGSASASATDLYPRDGYHSYSPNDNRVRLHLGDYGQVRAKFKCFLGQYILDINARFPETAQYSNPVTNFLLPYCPPVTGGDGTPPSAVEVTTDVQAGYVNISWTPATDDVGVDHYNVYVDGNIVYTTTGTSYTLVRPCGVFNDVMVSAVDAAGNFSTSAVIGVPATSCG